MNSRRSFIRKGILAGASLSLLPLSNVLGSETNISELAFTPFTLPPLPYAVDALEPWIDKQTMEIHHGKHHQAYVTNLNKGLESIKDASDDLDKILRNITEYPDLIRNNAGGHYNHSLFWKWMRAPKANNEPTGKLAEAINAEFGDFGKFKDAFKKESLGRFGSGWSWLIQKDNKKLEIISTANQDNPLMNNQSKRGFPILGLDVWEHAYYLKYQNKRADYVDGWWNLVNWDEVASRLK